MDGVARGLSDPEVDKHKQGVRSCPDGVSPREGKAARIHTPRVQTTVPLRPSPVANRRKEPGNLRKFILPKIMRCGDSAESCKWMQISGREHVRFGDVLFSLIMKLKGRHTASLQFVYCSFTAPDSLRELCTRTLPRYRSTRRNLEYGQACDTTVSDAKNTENTADGGRTYSADYVALSYHQPWRLAACVRDWRGCCACCEARGTTGAKPGETR